MQIRPKTENGIVSRMPKRIFGYHGWPTVCADENGVLYAVCSGGRVGHVCINGRTQLQKSFDGGRTWSAPILVNDTPVDDRDAGVLCLGGGTVLVSWFSHPAESYLGEYRSSILSQTLRGRADLDVLEAEFGYIETQCGRPELAGSFVRVSRDGGLTWGETVRVPVSAPHGPIRLADGTLFYLGHWMYCDEVSPDANAVYTSRDEGATWQKIAEVPGSEGYEEPHAVQLPGGRILGAFRCDKHGVNPADPDTFTVLTSYSDDGGRTWSPLKTPGICGAPPHLLLHSSGALICSVGRRKEPFGQRAYVSYDGGETWADEYVLRDDGFNGDLGYPATAELPDGSLITVYYQLYDPADEEKRSILSTRWRLER